MTAHSNSVEDHNPDEMLCKPARPSLRDIARRLGLSHVAVSLALKDSPRVSPSRKAEIKALAEKLGYRPDPMLSALAAYRRGKKPVEIRSCLAWLNQWDDPDRLRSYKEFDAYWEGARSAAERLGYRLEEFRWARGQSGRRLQRILLTRDVRGILLPPHREGLDLPDFDWGAFSIVRFGASIRHPAALCVTSDQSHCGRLAVEKALERGYTRIGYISSPRFERNTGGHFLAGFLNAQQKRVPEKHRVRVLEIPDDGIGGEEKLRLWLRKEIPEAVITTDGCLREMLRKIGARCPEDIAVVGISLLDGNFDAAADQNSFEIGRVAANSLAGLILENDRGIPRYGRRILVEGRWVDGSSLPTRKSG